MLDNIRSKVHVLLRVVNLTRSSWWYRYSSCGQSAQFGDITETLVEDEYNAPNEDIKHGHHNGCAVDEEAVVVATNVATEVVVGVNQGNQAGEEETNTNRVEDEPRKQELGPTPESSDEKSAAAEQVHG